MLTLSPGLSCRGGHGQPPLCPSDRKKSPGKREEQGLTERICSLPHSDPRTRNYACVDTPGFPEELQRRSALDGAAACAVPVEMAGGLKIVRPAGREPVVLCASCRARFGEDPPGGRKPASAETVGAAVEPPVPQPHANDRERTPRPDRWSMEAPASDLTAAMDRLGERTSNLRIVRERARVA